MIRAPCSGHSGFMVWLEDCLGFRSESTGYTVHCLVFRGSGSRAQGLGFCRVLGLALGLLVQGAKRLRSGMLRISNLRM